MKRLLAATLAATALAAMSGCASKAADVKTGIGSVATTGNSTPAGEDKSGNAQVDVTTCALTVDKDGTILSVSFDATAGKVGFDTKGQIITELDANVKSKKELGAAYGMKKFSGVGKEWNEQVAALEDWMVGKKVDEATGMKLYDKDPAHTGIPDEEALKSSVTISVTPFLRALEKAYASIK